MLTGAAARCLPPRSWPKRSERGVPAQVPGQHVLIVRGDRGFEVRNLSRWYRMKVNGQVTTSAPLKTKDTIEVGPVRLTFLDEV